MISNSLRNFLATYVQFIRLVFRNDKKELFIIAGSYLLSVALIACAFFILVALLKSIILSTNFSMEEPLDILLMGHQMSLPKLQSVMFLLSFFLLSSMAKYLAEKRWYITIKKIVDDLAKRSSEHNSKGIRVGAIATIRVSAILLAALSPAIISIFSFLLLVYFDWGMALLTVFAGSIAAYAYMIVGRKTKRISGMISDDEDIVSTSEETEVLDGNDTSDRLQFISDLLQLKARSRLIANILFVLFIIGMVLYFSVFAHHPSGAYRLVLSSMLIYFCFNGIKIIGSKTVPLSRQYNLVKEFISMAG